MSDYTSIDMVKLISAMDAPAKRNFRITQSYHELCLALSERLEPGANWCCFATWASRQAGQTIRGEDLERALQAWADSPEAASVITGFVRETAGAAAQQPILSIILDVVQPAAALQRASDEVGKGNLKVYAEIARAFARFLSGPYRDDHYDEASISDFCNTLQPGFPPEGQEYLALAFRHYYRALFEQTEKARAELLLLANLEVGFHEQTRLQPEIAGALNAGVEDPGVYARRLIEKLFPFKAAWILFSWKVFRLFGRRSRLDQASHAFAEALRAQVRKVMTRMLMTLSMPDGDLRLGSDLQGHFPELLQHLQDPEIKALLAQVDPISDSLQDTGATDWADFSERIHYIADLFRKTHLDPVLLKAPFSPEETKAIKAD